MLPTWIWIQRNFGGKFKELWIERYTHAWTKDAEMRGSGLLERVNYHEVDETNLFNTHRGWGAEEGHADDDDD